MTRLQRTTALLLTTVLTGTAFAGKSRATAPQPALVKLVDSTGLVQLEAPDFANLPPQQKLLAYWLAQAAIAVDPIIYDQLSPYGTELKTLLEGIAAHRADLPPALRDKVMDYTDLFWVNHSNYNNTTFHKFLPAFSPDELKQAAEIARKAGAWGGSQERMTQMLTDLQRPIFDATYLPSNTVKNPPPGQDILTASANNFYQGVSLQDLIGFHELYPLNSRLVKQNGKLVEQVYRAGTPDGKIPPGLYANELKHAIAALQMAQKYADSRQQAAIADLIQYYQTGSPADWYKFDVAWVQDNPPVDFANGFIEVYRDARGQKGTAQSFVTVTDRPFTEAMQKLAQNAGYFERQDPWSPAYKNPHPHPPVAKAVEAVVETGDFNVNTIGDNLPNEQAIHAQYGTKNFIFTGSIRAFQDALGMKLVNEFAYSADERQRAQDYGLLATEMMTAMHEVIGHGSGRLSPQLQGHDPADYLKEYYSTLEETRADLVALWSFFDPKLIQLGLIPNTDVAKAAYDAEARNALIQLREVPTGDIVQEDHRRGTQLIVNYIRAKTGAIQPKYRDGKVYLVVTSYPKMREAIGMLLSELMRIKAEGDYAAIRDLVNTYGIHFNTKWRDQVLQRVSGLHLPTYWGGINADLILKGQDVQIQYPRNLADQRLHYAAINAQPPVNVSKTHRLARHVSKPVVAEAHPHR